MKKKFIYLFAVLCSMGLFTACSDDDGVKIPGSTTSFTTEDGLLLTVNGNPMVGKVATFVPASGDSKAKITLAGEPLDLAAMMGGSKADNQPVMSQVKTCGVIPGSPEVTIPIDVIDGEFSGNFETDYCKFNYKGGLSKSSLEMIISDVELKNKTLANTSWKLSELERDSWGDTISGVADPVKLDWNSTTPFKIEFMPGYPPIEMPISDIIKIVTVMPIVPFEANDTTLGLQEALPQLLHQVSFSADGNIRANYVDIASGATAPVESPANLAQYVVKDNKTILLFLNVQNIIYNVENVGRQAGAPNIDMTPIVSLLASYLPYLQNGIPLEYSLKGDNMSVFLNTEFLLPIVKLGAGMLENKEIQEMLVQLIENSEDMKNYADMMKMLIPQVPDVLNNTNKIEVGINLTKK